MKKAKREIILGLIIIIATFIAFNRFIYGYLMKEIVLDDGSKAILSRGIDIISVFVLLFLIVLGLIGIIIFSIGVDKAMKKNNQLIEE